MRFDLRGGVAFLLTAGVALSSSGCTTTVVRESPPVSIEKTIDMDSAYGEEDSYVVDQEGNITPEPVIEESNREDYSELNIMGITTTGVNFRTGDSTDYEKITTLPRGVTIRLLGLEESGWYQVLYNGQIGYVCGEYVKVIDIDLLTSQLEDMPSIISAVESTTAINVRIGPSVDYEKITTLPRGVTIRLLGLEESGWYQVLYNGQIGYICGEYVKVIDMDLLTSQLEDMPSIISAVESTTGLNVRIGPSVDYEKIKTVPRGTKFEIVERLENGWYKVIYNDDIAYVSGEFVSETYMIEGEPYKMVYMTNDSCIYDKPLGEDVNFISQYELAKVYGETDDYYLVESDAGIGYIQKVQTDTLTGTYVVVDISSQTLIAYRGVEEIFRTDVVTGKNSTPSDIGCFSIYAKQQDATLSGADYSTPVKYWMPYNGGEGLHDAWWRSVFGGDIYQESGSHGCVNLPTEAAEILYELLSVNDKVLVKK